VEAEECRLALNTVMQVLRVGGGARCSPRSKR
jgi:hypothetical protein